jgi:hypothetical protein
MTAADKKPDKVVVSAHVRREVSDKIEERAKLLGWSKSQFIARAIEASIAPWMAIGAPPPC